MLLGGSDLIVDMKALSWERLLMTSSKPNTPPFLSVPPLDRSSPARELSFVGTVETGATAAVPSLSLAVVRNVHECH